MTETADHRLLPRFRQSPLLARRRMEREQAKVLNDALEGNDENLPLRHELTKPGDPLALRGIPAIGRSVAGAIEGTSPERETVKRVTRRERVNEATTL